MNKAESMRGKKVLVGYHANCIDGFTSAWVTNSGLLRMGARVKIIPVKYGEEGEDDLQEVIGEYCPHELYLVDFSVSLDFVEWLNYKNLTTTILDHHKTAFERYFPGEPIHELSRMSKTEGGVSIVLDNNECGASLCWKYFYGKEATPHLINYVKDYDLWRFKFGDSTKYINKALREYEFTLKNWSELYEQLEDPRGHGLLIARGMELQQKHDAEVAKLVAAAHPCYLKGEKGLAVEGSYQFASDTGNNLAEISGTFGAVYQVDEEAGTINWSIRSKGDYDVSAIAAKFGGGGHKNAAGFKTSLDTLNQWGVESSE